MDPAHPLQLACPAKVNLALSIGAPLASGFHPLASWMVAVDFADALTLRPCDDGRSRFHITFDPAAPVPAKVDWPLEKDLAFRAHRLLEQHTGRTLPIDLTLRKVIPPGAGLGGGSSNAAATLVGVDRLYNLRNGHAKLVELAQTLGSDVGFLVGSIIGGAPSAIVTGLGERIEPAPLTKPIDLVLIFPPFGCPTGDVYRAFDRLRGPFQNGQPAPDEPRVRTLALQSPIPAAAAFNDLAEPACVVRPDLRLARDHLCNALQAPVHITGSGSTLFVLAPDATAARTLARNATATTGLPAVAAQTRR